MTYAKQPGRARQGTVYHADGSRTYPNGQTYTPVPKDQRKIGVNKPDHPAAVRFRGTWFVPFAVLPNHQRVMPETRPDSLAYEHMSNQVGLCSCSVCKRPEAERWRRAWRRDRGLQE